VVRREDQQQQQRLRGKAEVICEEYEQCWRGTVREEQEATKELTRSQAPVVSQVTITTATATTEAATTGSIMLGPPTTAYNNDEPRREDAPDLHNKEVIYSTHII